VYDDSGTLGGKMSDGRFKKGGSPWNAGTKKQQDLKEIRKCKDCGVEKIVTDFVKGIDGLYRFKCKECKNAKRRTGKISETRFKPGHDKGKRFEVGHTPWYKIKNVPHPSKGKHDNENNNRFTSHIYKEWKRRVLEIKGRKCEECGSDKRLSVHHIVPWKDNEALRFDVANGKPLCNSCHGKIEGFQKGREAHNKKCQL
jgi:5-methylcytosine-specific restriction endonuclease McrA